MDMTEQGDITALDRFSFVARQEPLSRFEIQDMLATVLSEAGLSDRKIHPEAVLEIWQVFGGHSTYIKKFCQCLVKDESIHSRHIVDLAWVGHCLDDLRKACDPADDLYSDPTISALTRYMVHELLGSTTESCYKAVRLVVDDLDSPIKGEVKLSKYHDLAQIANEYPHLFFKFKKDGETYIRLRIQWWKFTKLMNRSH